MSTEQAMVQVTAAKIARMTGFTEEEVAVVKNTVAKKTTNTELAFFLNVCKSVELNPFLKEIWCYKDNKENLLVFAGRDGFLKKAQTSPLWNGMTSSDVRENDKFEMDIPNAKVIHTTNGKERGKIIGAYAIVKPKNCEFPTIEWADFHTYNKSQFTWSTHPSEMIKKVAETHALKKAFGITGLNSEYDFEIKNETAIPVETELTETEIAVKNVIDELDKYEGKDKDELKRQCAEKQMKGEFTIEFANSILRKIGL